LEPVKNILLSHLFHSANIQIRHIRVFVSFDSTLFGSGFGFSVPGKQNKSSISQFINTILVSEGYKKYSIAVSEIYYCSSNSPYINIHLENQKYLHNETLKSISLKLNPEAFVRIHKSAIVNINMVVCCKTRLNGDYDVTLKNAVQLRVSRNFAPDFKKLFNKTHQLASK
jgi:DNA-binding LytR/AlgR family response regulator